MKKIYCVIFILMFGLNITCFAENSAESIYNNYLKNVDEYNELSLPIDNSENNIDIVSVFVNKILLLLTSEIKNNYRSAVLLISVSIISSLLKSFVSTEHIKEISLYGCYCACSLILIDSFKSYSDICKKAIDNLVDFTNLSVPVLSSMLGVSGYYKTASSLQGVFIVISAILNNLIIKVLFPFFYLCGFLSIINGISKTFNLSRFINLATKTVTYLMGVLMTVFGGILTFTGFSASAGDNLVLKTAKYTVSSFVPGVGGCLSDALTSVIYSSAVLKNTVGYIGFFIVLSICIIPVIKMSVVIFMYKLCSASSNLILDSGISSLVDSVCSVMVSMLGLILITTVVFLLFTGVVASIG